MGCMVFFNSCTDDTQCGDIDCGLNGDCLIDNGIAICQCDSSDNGVLLYNGTGCTNCIANNSQPCPENSTCTEQGCACNEGYEINADGTGCALMDTTLTDTSIRAQYVGAYLQTDENCSDASVDPATLVDYANVDITLNADNDSEVWFNNLAALDNPVRVILRTNQLNFEIPAQTTTDGHVFEGMTIGTLNTFSTGDTTLSIRYSVTPNGGSTDVCDLILNKQ